MKIKNFFYALFIGLIALLSNSCEPEGARLLQQGVNSDLNEFVYSVMSEWYLWYDKTPDIDYNYYSSPEEVLEAMLYRPTDKWSFITDTATFSSYYQNGEYVGLGVGLAWDKNNELRVSFVFNDGAMGRAGVKRGWKVLKINKIAVADISDISAALGKNKVGESILLTLESLEGTTSEILFVKSVVNLNAVLHKSIHQVGSKKVGYLVFQTFIDPAEQELDAAFDYFIAEGVSDLVLDLRYNGGGSTSIANHLAELIGGSQVAGKLFYKLIHNNKKTPENKNITLKSNISRSLNLDHLMVIAGSQTASASELIINGLSPYLDVKVVGENTAGKPVGMYAWKYSDRVLVPISFSLKNSLDFGEYYDGLPADANCYDDVSKDFGDPNESCLKQALYYIENGEFSGTISKKTSKQGIEQTGFRQEISAW